MAVSSEKITVYNLAGMFNCHHPPSQTLTNIIVQISRTPLMMPFLITSTLLNSNNLIP